MALDTQGREDVAKFLAERYGFVFPRRATFDDRTDDTRAIQAQVDELGDELVNNRGGPLISIAGPCIITDTITVRRKCPVFVGAGWGNRNDDKPIRSYIRWEGPPGKPMFRFVDCWAGAGMRGLRLIGNAASKPSAAIELVETADSLPNQQLSFEKVYIGSFFGETGDGDQFTDGILWNGEKVNNSEHRLEHIYLRRCSGSAIKQNSIQAVNLNLQHITVDACAKGITATGQIHGDVVIFLNNGIDLYVPFDDGVNQINALIALRAYYSENAGRMYLSEGVSKLVLNESQFQISNALNADGKVVKAEGNLSQTIIARDFRVTQASAPPAAPYFSMRNAAGGAAERQIVLDGVTGWSDYMTGATNGLDVASRGAHDRIYVYLRENQQSSGGHPARIAQNFIAGDGVDWDINRNHVLNNTALSFFDHFIGNQIDARWKTWKGADGNCAALITEQLGGTLLLQTGADAAGTMAANGVQLDLGVRNYRSLLGSLVSEFSLYVSAITNVVIFLGFTDQVAGLEIPFTLGAGNVLTSNASDAFGVLFDTAADDKKWWLAGVKADVDAAKQNTGIAPAAFSAERWRIEADANGTATFWRNGVKIGVAMNNAVTASTPLTPVVAAFSRSNALRDLFLDYALVQANHSA